MKKKVTIVKCKNKRLKKRVDIWHLCRSDLDAGCIGCYFIETHQGEHWLDDWAHCTCPEPVKYGDKFEITPSVSEKVKRLLPA